MTPDQSEPSPRGPVPRRRDRRGRGRRGPDLRPGPLTPRGVPAALSRRERFDRTVVAVAEELEQRWSRQLGPVEFAVEETPWLPDDWDAAAVPLASVAPPTATTPTRLVLFRRPIEHRAPTPPELAALVHTVLVEQFSELLGIPAEEVDPRYESD
ncbi:MAG: metallopeptidase family protein [Nocardioides sp.]|nr:metallopeptidase family protein [Nocardioides sp.]